MNWVECAMIKFIFAENIGEEIAPPPLPVPIRLCIAITSHDPL